MDGSIRVLVPAADVSLPASQNEMGVFGRRSSEPPVVREISGTALANSLSRLCNSLSQVLQNAEAAAGEFKLDEITVSAEISAEGNVTLIGVAQIGAAGSGTISLSFRR